jgi:hypothetical protein
MPSGWQTPEIKYLFGDFGFGFEIGAVLLAIREP